MALHESVKESIHRINFGDDWVDLRINLTVGDHQKALDAMVETYRDEDGQLQQRTSTGAFKLALLTQMIIAWSDDEDVNETTIADLPNWLAEELIEAIDTFGRKRSSAETRDPLSENSISTSDKQEDSGKSMAESAGQQS